MSVWDTLGLQGAWSRMRRRPLTLLASLLVTLGCLWLLQRGAMPVVPASKHLVQAAAWAAPAYAACLLVVLTLRAVRWHFLIRPLAEVPTLEVVAVNFVFFGSLLLLPLRLGELVRPALLRRPDRLSGWKVVGLVGAERIVDGLLSTSLLALALFAAPALLRSDGPATLVRSTAVVMLVVFGSALAVVVLFFFSRHVARRLVEKSIGLLAPRLGVVVADKVAAVAEGLEFLRQPRAGIPFLLFSVAYWAANVAATWVLLKGCGLSDAGVEQASALIGVLALGLLVPAAPGFFGTFQMGAYAGLSLYLAPDVVSSTGSVVVFWMYLVQVSVTLLSALAFLPISLSAAARPAPPSALSAPQPSVED